MLIFLFAINLRFLYLLNRKSTKNNLLDHNILYIYWNKKENTLNFIETIFYDNNFLHLTGIKYSKSAKDFFHDCLNKKISPKNIIIKKNDFIQLKLEVLENTMYISKSAKRIWNFNGNKVNIKIEKVIGNTHLCLGFSNLDSKNRFLRFYYPKTLLQDNLKNNTIEDNQIIAIFSKNKKEKLYSEVTYLSKDANLIDFKQSKRIGDLIDYENIYSCNLKYQEKIDEFKNIIIGM